MERAAKEAFAKRVISYYQNIAQKSKFKTAQHFSSEGTGKSTIYTIIRRYEATGSANYKPLPGKRATVATEETKGKILKLFKRNPSTSVRLAAKKLNIKKTTLQNIKVQKLCIKARAKRVTPKYVKDQAARAKTGCRRIYKKQLRKVLVIDDETYIPWEPEDIPGKKYFHSTNPDDVSYAEKVKPKAKFIKKILVWQAIDENGNISDPYVTEGTINSKIYLEECVKRRLLPFIDQHYQREEVLFWPDMATSHYARDVTSFLATSNVEYVQKSQNAPNVPQARGIETFWALCKAEYSKRRVKPKSVKGFTQIWKNISKKVAKNSGKAVMRKSLKSLREIGYRGVHNN